MISPRTAADGHPDHGSRFWTVGCVSSADAATGPSLPWALAPLSPTGGVWQVNVWHGTHRPGASPRSFDWGGGGRIQVSQNHPTVNSHFSLDFGHFILNIFQNLKVLVSIQNIFIKNRDFWWDIHSRILNRGRRCVPLPPPPPPDGGETCTQYYKNL